MIQALGSSDYDDEIVKKSMEEMKNLEEELGGSFVDGDRSDGYPELDWE